MRATEGANYNVTSLTDITGRVLERYYYSPYGTLEVVVTGRDCRNRAHAPPKLARVGPGIRENPKTVHAVLLQQQPEMPESRVRAFSSTLDEEFRFDKMNAHFRDAA